ncbi:MAG: DMT family transporter [Candidatus Heimdallarchaeaceae archaeon]
MNKEVLYNFFHSRIFSIIQAFFVTILWSSSWILIKEGLEDIPPIFFAGIRYTISSFILIILVFIFYNKEQTNVKISKKLWGKLIIYGFTFYTITQGAQFIGIYFLPTITVSMVYSFTPIIVVLFSYLILKEKSSLIQVLIVLASIVGVVLYFNPFYQQARTDFFTIGIIIVIFGVIANALATIIGRDINSSKQISPLLVTSISMTIGSITLLIVALIIEDLPKISLKSLLIILWLSIVNTAFAFTLWNKVMQKLKAVELIMINNSMLAQIAILAVIFLGECPLIIEWIGLTIVGLCSIFIQIFRDNEKKEVITKKNEN